MRTRVGICSWECRAGRRWGEEWAGRDWKGQSSRLELLRSNSRKPCKYRRACLRSTTICMWLEFEIKTHTQFMHLNMLCPGGQWPTWSNECASLAGLRWKTFRCSRRLFIGKKMIFWNSKSFCSGVQCLSEVNKVAFFKRLNRALI